MWTKIILYIECMVLFVLCKGWGEGPPIALLGVPGGVPERLKMLYVINVLTPNQCKFVLSVVVCFLSSRYILVES